MEQKIKSKVFLFIFVVSAAVLAWGVWANYRPTVIYGSCANMAERTTNITKRYSVGDLSEADYEQQLQECLREAGL